MSELFMPADSAHIKREREKARELKKSPWWQDRLRKGLCQHCGGFFPSSDLTMDHLVPLVRGGKTGKNNVAVSCKSCNNQKSHKTLVGLRLKKT